MIERLVDLHCKPGSPFEDDDRALARLFIEQHIHAGTYTLAWDGDVIIGFMCWIRTDRRGTDCVRAWGFYNVVYLAIPISLCGPIILITFDAISESAPFTTIARLFEGVKSANPDAQKLATFLVTRRRAKWVERRFPT